MRSRVRWCFCAGCMRVDARGNFQLRGRLKPRCAARVFGRAAAGVLRCEGVGGALRPEFSASPRLSPRIACPLNRQTPSWFNRGPFPALTARNVAAKWECGLCVSYRLRACASQDAGSRHAGGCRQAASTAWMISTLVSVPPLQKSARPNRLRQSDF
jgi:hypothetical protein